MSEKYSDDHLKILPPSALHDIYDESLLYAQFIDIADPLRPDQVNVYMVPDQPLFVKDERLLGVHVAMPQDKGDHSLAVSPVLAGGSEGIRYAPILVSKLDICEISPYMQPDEFEVAKAAATLFGESKRHHVDAEDFERSLVNGLAQEIIDKTNQMFGEAAEAEFTALANGANSPYIYHAARAGMVAARTIFVDWMDGTVQIIEDLRDPTKVSVSIVPLTSARDSETDKQTDNYLVERRVSLQTEKGELTKYDLGEGIVEDRLATFAQILGNMAMYDLRIINTKDNY